MVSGPVTAGTVGLTTTAGDLTLAGTVSGTTSVALAASGALNGAGGGVVTATLTARAGSGAAALTGGNSIGTLGASSAATDFSLTDAAGLVVSGPVTAGTVGLTTTAGNLTLAGAVSGTTSVALAASGGLRQTGGDIVTAALGASAAGDALLTRTNAIDTLAALTSGGTAWLTNGRTVILTGRVSGKSVTLDVSSGDLLQSAGAITAPVLSVNAAGEVALNQSNLISKLTNANAGGSVEVTNAQPLTVDAAITTGTAAGDHLWLTAPTIDVASGSNLVAPSIVLVTGMGGGAINVANAVTLDARGGSPNNSQGNPGYLPGTVGSLAPVDQTDLLSGGVYLTIGRIDSGPSGDLANGKTLAQHNGFDASYGTGVISLGNVTVGGPILRLALPDNQPGDPRSIASSGTISFTDLAALPNTNASGTVLVAWLGSGSATGTLSGQQLAVLTTSSNAVAGFAGAISSSNPTLFPSGSPAAAGAAGVGQLSSISQLTTEGIYTVLSGGSVTRFSLYKPNPKLQLSGCPISSINCRVMIFTEQLPPLMLPAFAPIEAAAQDDFDLLLPGISDQEY